jgi:hypothetical protein
LLNDPIEIKCLLDFDSISNNDWHVEGLYVRIKIAIEDESIHVGMIGIIQSISVCLIKLIILENTKKKVFVLEWSLYCTFSTTRSSCCCSS